MFCNASRKSKWKDGERAAGPVHCYPSPRIGCPAPRTVPANTFTLSYHSPTTELLTLVGTHASPTSKQVCKSGRLASTVTLDEVLALQVRSAAVRRKPPAEAGT